MVEFWLLLALIVLLVALRNPLKAALLGGLDNRAERIRDELDEAAKLHNEAKELLAKHQQKLAEGEKQADDIQAQAKTEAERLEARLRSEFEALTERRKEQANERIAQEEARAVREVRERAADLAARTTRKLITDRLGSGAADDAMRQAISEVERKLA